MATQFTSIDQVLRFDVTKEWVFQNWDRKSTGPTDVGLFSVRVPLVMGTQLDALAGSLTYYFNAQGQVEHISFRGRTGDSTQLVQLLTTRYQFQRIASPTGEQVYQVQYNGQVQSELRTHPESVLWSNSPNQSIAVELGVCAARVESCVAAAADWLRRVAGDTGAAGGCDRAIVAGRG